MSTEVYKNVVPHVVIIGGGFAGMAAAQELRGAAVRVTVVDRSNHYLFQPLLYQVALASLAPSDITVPIRWLLRKQTNATVLMADVLSIDPDNRKVSLRDIPDSLSYDYLIVASGASHSYFGHAGWEARAPGLKTLEDALTIRNRFLGAYERAEMTEDGDARRALQTFVIVGGGPTGVELAGLIPEIAKNALRGDYRRVDPAQTRVLLIEAGPRLLPSFPEPLAQRARQDLESFGVEVRTESAVTDIEDDVVCIGEEKIRTSNVLWAAGNQASAILESLKSPLDRAGRATVQPDLSLPSYEEVLVVGDAAAFVDRGSPVPGVAPAAMQEGKHAAGNILRSLAGQPRASFHYLNKGNLATIGRNRAIADFGFAHMAGFAAWFLWLFVHIMYLAGYRNRLSVLLQWGYAYFTYQRGVRLITVARTDEPSTAPGCAVADSR